MILEKIKKPNDIHKIPLEDFEPLAAEIRDFLIRSVVGRADILLQIWE